MFKRRAGQLGEARAERWLRRRGLKPLARNWSCRHGELDLIMHDGEVLVFVEVRLRTPRGFGSGVDSVDARKQRKLIQAASIYLARNPRWSENPCRFDVVSLEGPDGEIGWIRNAFEVGS